MNHRRILVADDLDESRAGSRRSFLLRKAAGALAARLDLPLEIVYVENPKAPAPDRSLASLFLEDWHDRHLRRLEEARLLYPQPCEGILKTGFPADVLLKALKAGGGTEIAVLGTHGRRGLKRLLLGSVAEEVVRRSARPVLVLGPKATKPLRGFKARSRPSLLLATDLGPNSVAAENYAVSLARSLGGVLTLVHGLWDGWTIATRSALYPPGALDLSMDEILRTLRKNAEGVLEQKARRLGKKGVRCLTRIVSGVVRPAQGIVQEAGKGHALVVMGTRGRSPLAGGVLGSTARETILDSPVPVITVHA